MSYHATAYNDVHPLRRAAWLKQACGQMVARGMSPARVGYYEDGSDADGRDTPSSYATRALRYEGIEPAAK